MKKLRILIYIFVATILLFTSLAKEIKDTSSAKIGQLINNQDKIGTIKIVKGTIEEKMIDLNDQDTITLFNQIKEIQVIKLSEDQDNNFMTDRIKEKSKLIIYFYRETNLPDSLIGELVIWPDGYIYAVDISSMKESQRTISYLSKMKYPNIYNWLNEKL